MIVVLDRDAEWVAGGSYLRLRTAGGCKEKSRNQEVEATKVFDRMQGEFELL